MPVDPRLLALPSLRRQAEAEARENYEASYLIHDPDGKSACAVCWDDMAATEDDPEDYTRTLAIDTHAALLANLTRWQSQAWAVRRIGALVWQEEPDYVPELNQAELELERGKHTVCWVLGGKCYGHPLWNDSHIPGISGMSRPEAIAAILLHLESQ